MVWTYYFKRIFSNKLKLAVALLFFLFPIGDLFLNLMDVSRGGSVYNPFIYVFLAGAVVQRGIQILLWFLPLYLLLLVAEDCIEDVKTGYKNVLIARYGKGRYVINNFLKGFIISFLLMFLSLALNVLMVQIIFNGGTATLYSDSAIQGDAALEASLQHPWLTNWIYILVTSFVSGFVGMGAVALSLLFPNRFLVYPLVFLIWYFPSTIRKSIMIALQPFTEFALTDVLSTILLVIGINIAAAIAAAIKVMKYDPV